MKYLREASDLHLDWDVERFHSTRIYDPNALPIREAMDMCWMPPSMADDFETTFIIAGDIWTDGRFANRKYQLSYDSNDTWIKRISDRKSVV